MKGDMAFLLKRVTTWRTKKKCSYDISLTIFILATDKTWVIQIYSSFNYNFIYETAELGVRRYFFFNEN